MPSSKPVPTLHDVAAHAGVSTATVSRYLNMPDKVVPRTREKVAAAIDALGYAPNFGARAMAAQRTMTIGAVIPTMENAVFAKGLQAFQEELCAHGFTLLVASSTYNPELEEKQIRALVGRGADGLLLIGHDRDPAIYRFLSVQGVPTLVAWAYDTAEPRASVGFDNRAAMAAMAAKAIGMGHRHLAMVSALTATNDRARARVQGVRDAMDAASLDGSSLCLIETRYGIDSGGAAFTQVMQRQPRTTAVFCGNDVLAVGALRAARTLGLAVPEDVSITGFDDIDLSVVTHPLLTTVHVPHRKMGQQAARALVGMVLRGEAAQTTELATRLTLRESLRAPPSG
jgi:LacI family transcriptional regulator